MSDKFKNTHPVPVAFSEGEQPTSTKLSAWASQVKSAFNLVEKAVGDVWSNNFPLFSSDNTHTGEWAFERDGTGIGNEQRHLQILNLARLIGPASVLNPHVLSDLSDAPITAEAVPTFNNNFYLRWAPVNTVVFSNGTRFDTLKASRDLVHEAGDYWLDEDTGEVVVGYSNGTMGTVTYNITSGSYITDTYTGATYNVIPDPNQDTKCAVTGPVSGKYTITVPTIGFQQINEAGTDSELSQSSPNYVQNPLLPAWLTTEYPVANTALPDGLFGLWDKDNSAFVQNLTFYSNANRTTIKASGATLEVSTDRYSLVTIGTDISRLLDSLRTKFYRHNHDGTHGDKRVKHEDLDGNAKGYFDNGTHGFQSLIDDGNGDFPSDHPQYLGRWGSDSSFLKNAMLGTLLMGSIQSTSPGVAPFDLASNSYRIQFGSTSGPYLRYDASDDLLSLTNRGLVVNEELYTRRGVNGGDRCIVGGTWHSYYSREDLFPVMVDTTERTIYSHTINDNPFSNDLIMKGKFYFKYVGSVPSTTIQLKIKIACGSGDLTIAEAGMVPFDSALIVIDFNGFYYPGAGVGHPEVISVLTNFTNDSVAGSGLIALPNTPTEDSSAYSYKNALDPLLSSATSFFITGELGSNALNIQCIGGYIDFVTQQ